MGRRRKYRQAKHKTTESSTSHSGSSVSEPSFDRGFCEEGDGARAVNKKLKTASLNTSTPVSVRESLSKFAFRPTEDQPGAIMEERQAEKDNVFSPEKSSPARITNEDLMHRLCANSSQISKLSSIFEELRSELFALRIENDQLKKEVEEAKKREEEVQRKLAKTKFIADLADRRSEELSTYVRRNNLRIFGVDETTEGSREESSDDCEKKVLAIFRDKLKLKVESADIEAVHRLGARRPSTPTGGNQQQQRPPRGIIVRFISRRV